MPELRSRFGPARIAVFAAGLAAAIAGGGLRAQQPDTLDLDLPPDQFLTLEGCTQAVSELRDDVGTGGQFSPFVLLQMRSQIDGAELLCEAGKYGAAEVLLNLARTEFDRSAASPPSLRSD